MTTHVYCTSCELKLLAFDGHAEPKPVGYDSCPNCGGTAFAFDLD